MNEATANTARAMKLPDDTYYSDSDKPFEELAEAMALGSGQSAADDVQSIFALGLPGAAVVERGVELPAAVLLSCNSSRQWEANFDANLRVLVVDLHTGDLRTFSPMLLDSPEFDPSRSGPPPSALDRIATLNGFRRFNIPAVFGDDWPSTVYAVTALYYDWTSNTVLVKGRPPADFAPASPRIPSEFLDKGVNGTPGTSGLRLTVAAVPEPAGAIPVQGSFMTSKDSVTLAPMAQSPDRFVMVGELLLVALDDPYLRTVNVTVPVEVHGENVSGSFAFDLAQRPEAKALAGELQVFWVSGRTVSEPAVVTVTLK